MTMTRAQLVHGHRLFFAGVFSVAVLVVLHAPDAGAGTTASSADSIEWTVLVPEELVSSGGASFTKQDDGSILVGGAAVEKRGECVSSLRPHVAVHGDAVEEDHRRLRRLLLRAIQGPIWLQQRPERVRRFAGL